MLLNWHPCGLAMDFLRRGKHSYMRMSPDAEPIPIVWYRVPWDRPMYQKPTVFRSRNWEPDHEWSGVGEQEGPKCCDARPISWYDSHEPYPTFPPYRPCGSDAVARRGAGPGDPAFLTNEFGAAPCCSEWDVIDAVTLGVGVRLVEREIVEPPIPEDLAVGVGLVDLEQLEQLRVGVRLVERDLSVLEPCCGWTTTTGPATLYALFSGSMAWRGTVTLTKVTGAIRHEAVGEEACSFPLFPPTLANITLECSAGVFLFHLSSAAGVVSGGSAMLHSCTPFRYTANGTDFAACGGGSWAVEIRDTPPPW